MRQMASELQAVIKELGGHQTLGRALSSDRDLREAIREGFPPAVVEELLRASGLSLKELAESLDLDRRRLKRSNRALGGLAPIAAIDTEPGARQVENVLGRIAYGGIS